MMKTTMVVITLALGAGCALEDEPLTTPELGQRAQGLGVSNVTDRPLTLTSSRLTD